jgi:hypothetical protein
MCGVDAEAGGRRGKERRREGDRSEWGSGGGTTSEARMGVTMTTCLATQHTTTITTNISRQVQAFEDDMVDTLTPRGAARMA